MGRARPQGLKKLWTWSAMLGAALVGVGIGLLLQPPGTAVTVILLPRTAVTVILLLVGFALLGLGLWRGKTR